ncbi:MAG: DUF4026 domain-containing protein [Bacteroidia bacterium]|nr:DUF4026 domain-containing protein [Bacteroidia bacterium]
MMNEDRLSHMMVLPYDISTLKMRNGSLIEITQNTIERLKANEEFSISDIEEIDAEFYCNVAYKEKIYPVNIYYRTFDYETIENFRHVHAITDDENEILKQSDEGVMVVIENQDNPLDAFHLHLKLLHAIFPDNILAVLDYSAGKLLNGNWTARAAEASAPPSPIYLFSIHGVSNEHDNTAWIHTHGLLRYGLSELDILQSPEELHYDHQMLLQALATFKLYNGESEDAYIGILSDETPIVCAMIPWPLAEDYYKMRGKELPYMFTDKNPHDEEEAHSVVFLYTSEDNYEKGIYDTLDVLEKEQLDNPLYFFTTAETQRMKTLAQERVSILRQVVGKEGYSAIVKMGIIVDDEHKDASEDEEEQEQREYLWFELLAINDSILTLKATQDAYYIERVREGAEIEHDATDLTDWIIYAPDATIGPDEVYLLQEDKRQAFVGEEPQTLEEKLVYWHEIDKHNKVIEAIEQIPDEERTFDLIEKLARAYNNVDREEDALKLMKTVQEEGADDAKWNFRMGYAYFYRSEGDREGNLLLAINHFSKAHSLDPADPDAPAFIKYCKEGLADLQ